MKKTMLKLFVTAALCAAFTLPANAQLGNILKKGKQIIEKTSKAAGAKTNETSVAIAALTAKEIEQPCGGTMINPFNKHAEIELLGAYGKSTSENYGYVYLVFRVKMLDNKGEIYFRGAFDGKDAMAIDMDGNAYKMAYTMGKGYDVEEGTAIKVVCDHERNRYVDVRKSVSIMQKMTIGVYINGGDSGMLTMKNVPIKWDEEP